ncbi:MAG: Uma2 family endonuclease [Gemmataceae bacterium]|nr:Uma2 family endonuclease [Gemmataceae bacterium]
MTLQPPFPNRLTREQYYDLGRRGVFDGLRVELIFGRVVVMSPINWPHTLGVGLVTDALRAAFATGHWVNVQPPLTVPATSPVSEPQPDVAVIPGTPRSYTDHPTVAALVVEVSDSTLTYDLTTKAEVYATAGVADYWVLDVVGRELHVLRDPTPAASLSTYHTHLTLGVADTISPPAAATATIPVADLLP